MALRRAARLAQLWQLPLLLLSLGLFGYAAYLFIDPKPGLTTDQKIEIAQAHLTHQRPRAAVEQLNRLLQTEKLAALHEARIHQLLAQALDEVQKIEKFSVADNHLSIIEQTRLAMRLGIKADADMHQRMADSYRALSRPADAVANYRQAANLDPARAVPLERKIAELQLSMDDPAAAAVTLEKYLGYKELAAGERAWALTQLARVYIDRTSHTEARRLLGEALELLPVDPPQNSRAIERFERGQIYHYLGVCAYGLGELDQAERSLRLARDQLGVQHAIDADAAYLLGKIHEGRGEARTANSFFDAVLTSHPDSKVAPLARLGRGVNRIAAGEQAGGLTDLSDLIKRLSQRPEARNKHKAEVIAGLRTARALLEATENYQGAIEVLQHEQELQPQPEPSFFARLASVYERRADQIERAAPSADLKPADRIRREQTIRDLRTRAGDACVAYARAMVLNSDASHSEGLWKGIQLYNRAGDQSRVIAALEIFVHERPDDPLAPDALLQLGQAYQAAGLLDKAIGAFAHNQARHTNTLAASKSAVPLAMAYIAKGPEFYAKAETVLRGVVENNRIIDPSAEEFRQSLFELANLYYRTQRFEQAIARLEEMTQRYGNDQRTGQLVFLMGDSYRKSATQLDTRLASAKPDDAVRQAIDLAEAAKARMDRLQRARQLFDRTIEVYRGSPPAGELDRMYLRLAHFYRADCVFDLGEYAEAIRLYDAAAFRYQDDPSALAAYVQIVNANCALGKTEEAKAANERAKWLLRRMPPDAFQNGTFSMPKEYWEQWLRWSGESGMW